MQQELFSKSPRGLAAMVAGTLLLALWDVPAQGQQQFPQSGAQMQFGPGPNIGMGGPGQGMNAPQMRGPGETTPSFGPGMRDLGRQGMDQGGFRAPSAPQTFNQRGQPFGGRVQQDLRFDADRFQRTPQGRFPEERRVMRPESLDRFDRQQDRFSFESRRDRGRDEFDPDGQFDRSFDFRDRSEQEFGRRRDFGRQDFDRQQDFRFQEDFDRREVQRQDTTRQDNRGATTTRIASAADLGLSVSQSERDRLVIRDVRQNTLAARAGLRPGDVILAVNRRPVTAFRDFDAFLARTDFFVQPVPILVLRDGYEEIVYIRPAAYGRDETNVEYVDALDNYFKPAVLRVPPGTTVRWTNRGRHSHTVTADDHSWDSRELYPDESFSLTFHEPGTHYYYCRYHTRDRMEGVVVVGDRGGRAYEGGSSY